jgi:hypothetical protein
MVIEVDVLRRRVIRYGRVHILVKLLGKVSHKKA